MMRAVNFSAQLSWTGTIQCKLNGTWDLIMPHLLAASVRAGIRDRADGYIVTEMSFPTFLYEKYSANQDHLEEGLFKSAILVQVRRTYATRRKSNFRQAFKSIFTSPSSAKEIDGEGDGANIIENNRRAKREVSGRKVKTHVAQIIKMHKVSPRSIAYVACQVSDVTLRLIPEHQYYVTLAVTICTFCRDVMALSRWRFRLCTVLAYHRRLFREGSWPISSA